MLLAELYFPYYKLTLSYTPVGNAQFNSLAGADVSFKKTVQMITAFC